MASIKGGRGKKAPYESILIKVPKPIKEDLQAIANHWRITGEFPHNDQTSSPLSRQTLEALAKKLSKKAEIPQSWQVFIDCILELQSPS